MDFQKFRNSSKVSEVIFLLKKLEGSAILRNFLEVQESQFWLVHKELKTLGAEENNEDINLQRKKVKKSNVKRLNWEQFLSFCYLIDPNTGATFRVVSS
jgi:hypothetical protein